MKLDESKCKSCYGKRYYTVMVGIVGHDDFGVDGFVKLPEIHKIACKICNKGNRRRIKDVRTSMFF